MRKGLYRTSCPTQHYLPNVPDNPLIKWISARFQEAEFQKRGVGSLSLHLPPNPLLLYDCILVAGSSIEDSNQPGSLTGRGCRHHFWHGSPAATHRFHGRRSLQVQSGHPNSRCARPVLRGSSGQALRRQHWAVVRTGIQLPTCRLHLDLCS